MNNDLISVYEYLIDKDISITDLYIYHYLINNEDCFAEDDDFKNLFNKIKNNYINDLECRSLDYHINTIINNMEDIDE